MRISDWSSDVCSSDLRCSFDTRLWAEGRRSQSLIACPASPVFPKRARPSEAQSVGQTVIAGTAGEAIHALDGILGHDGSADLTALHVDGGGVSDIVFAVMHQIGRAHV